MTPPATLSRRRFLAQTARLGAAGVAGPNLLPAGAFGAAGRPGANGRPDAEACRRMAKRALQNIRRAEVGRHAEMDLLNREVLTKMSAKGLQISR